MLSLVILAQLSSIPTAPPASTPREIYPAGMTRTPSLAEAAGATKGKLVWPTDVPRPLPTEVQAEIPAPLPTYPPTPTLVPRPKATPLPVEPVDRSTRPLNRLAFGIGIGSLAVGLALHLLKRRKDASAAEVQSMAPPRPSPRPPRPAVALPVPAPVAPPLEGAGFEWSWGGKVGKAEELDVIGPGGHYRLLRRWGDRRDGEMQAVGESHYQDELETLVDHVVREDVRSGSFNAWLRPEPENEHDSKAVAVFAVEEPDLVQRVAYLSRGDARRWQPRLLELEARCGRGYLAHGRVIRASADGFSHSVVIQGDIGTLEEIITALDAPQTPKPRNRRNRTSKGDA